MNNRQKMTTRLVTSLSAACLALAACGPTGTAAREEGTAPMIEGESFAVQNRPLELSGCAAVEGGILIVEDELIGGVLHVPGMPGPSGMFSLIKLERKKKQRAPFAPAYKLFPVQDFEDIASDGKKDVYLLGSHNGKDGERRPDREFLLQAEWDAKDAEMKVVGENYALLDALAPAVERLGSNIGLSKTEVSAALNIEGLAYNDGTLYIGLRAPLSAAGNAIVAVATVADVFGSGGLSLETLEADLNGGGIRALHWDPKGGGLLAISGPPADGDAVGAALWRIEPADGTATAIHTFDEAIARKQPEGICRLAERDGGGLLVVLDGGGEGGSSEVIVLSD